MTAQEYLVRAYNYKLLIRNKYEQLNVLRDLVSCISVPTDREFVSGTKDVHSMEGMIASITDLENEIKADENTFAQYEFENITIINKLSGYKERRIMLFRYVRCMDWSAIASDMNLSKRRVQTIHKQALDLITDIMKREGIVPDIEKRQKKGTYVRFERRLC